LSVSFERRGNVAVALVDRPPVNAIDSGVRAGLLDAAHQTTGDPSIDALVIACRGRTFLSGADLSELDAGVSPPPYDLLLRALESCPKPVVAALHGTPLGGGLEIAMACHYRCATPGTRSGMPEITLGIVPGAGGTQRLPRLVGIENALDLLLSGALIDSTRARDLGLIDEIVGDDALEGGIEYARRLVATGAGPRPTGSRPAPQPPLAETEIAKLLARHARALKGRNTQTLVLEAVRAVSELSFADGLKLEARLSAASLETLESRALRHVFFAERECGRVPGIEARQGAVADIGRAAVVGAGTMGSGIAMALADAGVPVSLIEREPAALERGQNAIRDNYAQSVQRGRIDAATARARQALIEGSLSLDAAGGADLIIEAVFEDFELKRSVLTQLDAIVRPQAILASNTSSLSLTSLASASRHPERVIGLHFFSPANVMRLLEIVRGAQTSDATILAGLALAKKLRKVGVVVGDGFGFVGNRMMLDGYFREVELMLLQGVVPERIDAVMEHFGFAMGPNRVNDMAGIDVGTRVRAELVRREARQPPYHVVSDALTPLGRLGQKTGRGIYRYEAGNRAPLPDPELPSLIRSLAAKYGVDAREVSDAQIEQRCVLSLINVGAQILDEGLAYRAADIDVVWSAGYGFPRWRGGPMFHADTLGIDCVVAQIESIAASGGGDYWRVSPLLRQLAADKRKFADWDRGRGS
jgi:3-hydroxyacyl-CoA dehydrogenase